MTEIEIKNSIDPLLKNLSEKKDLESAESVISELVEFLGIKTEQRYLLNIPRVDAELSRFELAPGFAKQPSAFGINHNKEDLIDLKLYWVKKTTKTNLSWLVGLTPNFEDSPANDFDKVGIDFVIPEKADSLIILISNRFKIRSLEIHEFLTPTQVEIFKKWGDSTFSKEVSIEDQKQYIHSHLWTSFDFEPVNRQFYCDLVESFSLLVQHLEDKLGRKPSVMFTTRLIGRLLFIWFLKKKNLINLKVNYFDILESESQLDFYKNKLELLFFETLNKEISDRSHEDKLTPYLNGGLFDINENDFYENLDLSFPNKFFNQLFQTLNKYNFTVDESSPEFQHVAIDPEMLGRIFESLLAEQIDENNGSNQQQVSGAFYTPREIVNYMCEESIIEFLKTKILDSNDRNRRLEELVRLPETIFRDQDQNKRRDWKPYADLILNELIGNELTQPITILDPAVGSGAFPMGMLHLLVKIITRLDSKYEKNISKLKREILSKSIYGVDIEQTAIEICRLRAWLSIIVDVNINENFEPLPNLDFKFICANTLIELDDSDQQSLFEDSNLKEKLILIRDQYYKTSSQTSKLKLQHEYNKLTHTEDLFDNKRTRQLKSYQPFDISSSSSFYDPSLHHGVSNFDIVIGNPPYYQLREINEDLQVQYKKTRYHKYAEGGRLNIFQYFIPYSITVAKNNGIICLITQNSLLSEDTAINNRQFIFNNSKILKFISFPERDNVKKRVFESVKMSVAISLLQKKKDENDNNFQINVWREKQMINCQSLETSKKEIIKIYPETLVIPISSQVEFNLLKKIRAQDNVYYLNALAGEVDITKFSQLFNQDKNGKRVITGAQIHKFQIIDNPQQGGINYLANDLIPDSGKFIYSNYERIAIQRITGVDSLIRLVATIVPSNHLLANSCNFIINENPGKLRYELAIFNSSLINKFFKFTSTNTNVTTSVINAIPIPIPNEDTIKKLSTLIDQILTLKKSNKNTLELELEIDIEVFKLYKLSDTEISIITT